MLFSFLLLLLSTVLAQNSTHRPISTPVTSNKNVTLNPVCILCKDGLDLLATQIDVLDHLTSVNLAGLVDNLCQKAPRKIPIVDALCTVLRDDLVDALIRLVRGLKDETNPSYLCKKLIACS